MKSENMNTISLAFVMIIIMSFSSIVVSSQSGDKVSYFQSFKETFFRRRRAESDPATQAGNFSTSPSNETFSQKRSRSISGKITMTTRDLRVLQDELFKQGKAYDRSRDLISHIKARKELPLTEDEIDEAVMVENRKAPSSMNNATTSIPSGCKSNHCVSNAVIKYGGSAKDSSIGISEILLALAISALTK